MPKGRNRVVLRGLQAKMVQRLRRIDDLTTSVVRCLDITGRRHDLLTFQSVIDALHDDDWELSIRSRIDRLDVITAVRAAGGVHDGRKLRGRRYFRGMRLREAPPDE